MSTMEFVEDPYEEEAEEMTTRGELADEFIMQELWERGN